MSENSVLVRAHNIYKEFPVHAGLLEELHFENGRFVRKRESVKAINGVQLEVRKGEALCVVGESGCGKSTVARVIMGLIKPTVGEVYYDGERIDNLHSTKLLRFRRKMQMIFQNPYASLNPRMTVQDTLEEPIRFHNPDSSTAEVQEKVKVVMDSVGVDPIWGERYPHEFSGGQRQRISIARALAVDPEFIVADEPISALDVSIQAQVLNLLKDAETRTLFSSPRHPYTQALLSAIPRLNEERPHYIKLKGEVPTPINLPSGCVFHGRCIHANGRCQHEMPKLRELGDGTAVACHAVEEGRL
jgi:peptide/nickel transport system ATP-binding protein